MHQDFFLEGVGNRDADIYTSFFVCNTEEGDIKLSHEHSAFIWASPEDAGALDLTPSAKFGISTYLNLKNFLLTYPHRGDRV